jgi:hypothetical protein
MEVFSSQKLETGGRALVLFDQLVVVHLVDELVGIESTDFDGLF